METTNREAGIPLMMGLLTGKLEGQIEAQEARGQAELIRRCVLPIKGFEQAGCSDRIKILSKHDDLFNEVELPEGWSIVATDHSMWSQLLDEKKRERAGIFYKAAFYDRSAHMHWNRFFSLETDASHENETTLTWLASRDGEKFFSRGIPSGPEPVWERISRMQKEITEATQKNFPNWEDPAAYWT